MASAELERPLLCDVEEAGGVQKSCQVFRRAAHFSSNVWCKRALTGLWMCAVASTILSKDIASSSSAVISASTALLATGRVHPMSISDRDLNMSMALPELQSSQASSMNLAEFSFSERTKIVFVVFCITALLSCFVFVCSRYYEPAISAFSVLVLLAILTTALLISFAFLDLVLFMAVHMSSRSSNLGAHLAPLLFFVVDALLLGTVAFFAFIPDARGGNDCCDNLCKTLRLLLYMFVGGSLVVLAWIMFLPASMTLIYVWPGLAAFHLQIIFSTAFCLGADKPSSDRKLESNAYWAVFAQGVFVTVFIFLSAAIGYSSTGLATMWVGVICLLSYYAIWTYALLDVKLAHMWRHNGATLQPTCFTYITLRDATLGPVLTTLPCLFSSSALIRTFGYMDEAAVLCSRSSWHPIVIPTSSFDNITPGLEALKAAGNGLAHLFLNSYLTWLMRLLVSMPWWLYGLLGAGAGIGISHKLGLFNVIWYAAILIGAMGVSMAGTMYASQDMWNTFSHMIGPPLLFPSWSGDSSMSKPEIWQRTCFFVPLLVLQVSLLGGVTWLLHVVFNALPAGIMHPDRKDNATRSPRHVLSLWPWLHTVHQWACRAFEPCFRFWHFVSERPNQLCLHLLSLWPWLHTVRRWAYRAFEPCVGFWHVLSERPNLLCLFLIYHLTHNCLLFLLMSYALRNALISPSTGIDWEVWVIWLQWLTVISVSTCLCKYAAYFGRKLPSPIANILMQITPGIGNDIHLFKDWIFIANCIHRAECNSGLLLFVGYLLAALSCGFLFWPLGDLLADASAAEAFIAAHWPVVVDRPALRNDEQQHQHQQQQQQQQGERPRYPDPFGWLNVLPPAMAKAFLQQAVDQTTRGKYVITLKTEAPQSLLAITYAVIFGGSPFVLTSIAMSSTKVLGIPAVQRALPPLLETSREGAILVRYVLQTAEGRLSARVFSGESTALHVAIKWGAAEGADTCARLLDEETQGIDTMDSNGQTPLVLACARGDMEIVGLLLRCQADSIPGFKFFLEGGDVSGIRSLLQANAGVNDCDTDGHTPLMLCLSYNTNMEKIAEVLLQSKADINATSSSEWSPLTFAADAGLTSMVQYLVASSANLSMNLKNLRASPLFRAVRSRHMDTVRVLLGAGLSMPPPMLAELQRDERKPDVKRGLEDYCITILNKLQDETIKAKLEGSDQTKVKSVVEDTLNWLDKITVAQINVRGDAQEKLLKDIAAKRKLLAEPLMT